ncbi:MAG TPA: EamA family transporter [Bryobacteraceae bacterium]|jgi:drug/metabolite transporter (DMT)-like permease|nr:EamA family transporter [Bryobacteraceae bacterium]
MRSHPHFKAYLALAAVCLFWGTTYLGIRMALESLPPLMLVGLRYSISGSVLLLVAFFAKAHLPSGRELFFTALYGVIIIGIGNGCLAFAEVWIPSGLAALFITTSPFWMVGMEALIPGGDRLHAPTLLGMLVGLAGTSLLVAPNAIQQGWGGPLLRGFLVLQLGCCGWAFGSILQRRQVTKAHPVVSGAVQQLATGLVFMGPALLTKTQPIHWTPRSIAAVLYLVTFGSVVGYSAYLYALDKLPVSVVSIYNYVNPVVAVFLGWLFYREKIGVRELLAMLVIFAGVALVKRYGRGKNVT